VHGFTKVVWVANGMSVVDSYIHDQTSVGDMHTDVVMIDGGSNILIQHSYIKSGEVEGHTTGALAVLGDYGGCDHVTMIDNYAAGIQGWDISGGYWTSTYIVAIGNALSPRNGWGGTDYVRKFDVTAPGNVWSNNYNSETLEPIAANVG
jgi:hypothetical protein